MRAAGGELDIVALRSRTLHIVEVKACLATVRTGEGRAPRDAVTPLKRRRLVSAARAVAQRAAYRGRFDRVSFDVAEVTAGWGGRLRVRLLKDAFRADEVGGSSGAI